MNDARAHPFCDHAVNFVRGCAVVDGTARQVEDDASVFRFL
jgi:hypothetical protein